ncbi:MAG: M1 family aminopeptidase [bacterium]|nr:M1 family aminopeptidase [bacterium]
MKFILSTTLFVLTWTLSAQEHACAKVKQASMANYFNQQAKPAAASPQISHDMKYDVKFVHLDLKCERTNKAVSGNVKTIATVTSAVLDTFMTLLHQNYTIDSVRFNGVILPSLRQDSMIKVGIPVPLPGGSTFTSQVYYNGIAPTGGSAIGSGYSNASSPSWGNQATWSLSESFVAYHWWPCKQALTDKIDSSWVFVTTDSTNKVGSNGLLKNVVIVGNKKRYEWKSKTPIDYYLISVAVAKYKEYNLYAKPQYLVNDSILIQNYIYDGAINNTNWINGQKQTLNKLPKVLEFLSNMYGMYPFRKEKYGHCMAPLGGGMEHQTMTTLGFFDYYVDAHELGHQWWGDQVTCKTWGDIWINEGFASYTEHLVAQYLDNPNFATNLDAAHQNVMSQPGGSIYFTNSDTLNTARIFSSRLTYDKGGAIIHSLRFLTNNDSLWFNTLRGFQSMYKNSTASAQDFKNYYQAQTGINATQFFSQWYYGEGYPTFSVKYNFLRDTCFMKSTETVSLPSVTPLFITPMQYKISRISKADTTVRLNQNTALDSYKFPLTGTITQIVCDPNNWIINKAVGPSRDFTLGVLPTPTAPPNTAGIEETNQNYEAIRIGPNPTKEALYITNPLHASGKLQLFDVTGKLLEEKALCSENYLNLKELVSGFYLLRILDSADKERCSQKIIRE